MRIAQLMTQPAVTCSIDDCLDRPAQLMWDHDCGALPVVGSDGKVAGIVTDRDICMAAYTQGRTLREIPVRTAMSKQVFCCRPEDTVDAAERLMSEKKVRRVPIVDSEQRPVGVLSLNDVAREAVLPRNRNSNAEHEVASTLAAVCEPRGHGSATGARGAAAAATV